MTPNGSAIASPERCVTMAHKQLEHSDVLFAGAADAAGVHLFTWQWQQGHSHALTQRCYT